MLVLCVISCVFFFFKQKTAYEMRISDWSSDVCSSDLRVGAHVRQGQVIAFVGMTGLATGPHLHYEFRINGVHKNPVTVALPRANPLPASRSEESRVGKECVSTCRSRC